MIDVVRAKAAAALLDPDGSFEAAEEVITHSGLPGTAKAAVWLYVWSLQSRDEQLRLAEDAMRELALVHD